MNGCVLAVDQGTSNTKALLVTAAGRIVARASQPVERHYPRPGWVEQDPLAIWESVRLAIDAVLAQVGGAHPVALAISSQRESVVLWDRGSGAPLGPCVSWQCRRGDPYCAHLRAQGAAALIEERSGLPLDPMFSAAKARWLLDHLPDGASRAGAGKVCLGTVDSWLLWNLTGGAVHACDTGNASRTQLFNIRTLRWDSELLALFGIPEAALPRVQPSGSQFGATVRLGALPAGVPITALLGDSHAALFGQGGFQAGTIKATYGTGTSLMTPMRAVLPAAQGIAATVAWATTMVTYALEGNISVSGAVVEWLGRLLQLPDPVRGVADLAARVPDAGGVYLVPAFVGLGAPHWDAEARGLICGLTDTTSAPHLARAALDAIAFQVRDVFDAMRRVSPESFQVLLADGGASHNDLLMQLQADYLGVPVARATSGDLSALGAAYMGGLTAGIWSSEDEVASLIGPRDRFEPLLDPSRREEQYQGWQTAVARARLAARPAQERI